QGRRAAPSSSEASELRKPACGRLPARRERGFDFRLKSLPALPILRSCPRAPHSNSAPIQVQVHSSVRPPAPEAPKTVSTPAATALPASRPPEKHPRPVSTPTRQKAPFPAGAPPGRSPPPTPTFPADIFLAARPLPTSHPSCNKSPPPA